MLPFQVALEELCVQKPRSYQRAEDIFCQHRSLGFLLTIGGEVEGLKGDSLSMGVYVQVMLKCLIKLAVGFKRSKGLGWYMAFFELD